MPSVFVKRSVIVSRADRDEFLVDLVVHAPIRSADGDFGCEVRASGLLPIGTTIFGIDEWHALVLALGFISRIVTGIMDDGSEIRWANTRELMSNEDFWMGHGNGPPTGCA